MMEDTTAAASAPPAAAAFPAETDPLHEVRIRSRSKEPHLLHANIVLTALTDVIASQGITSSSSKSRITSAYFGALMIALDAATHHSADTLSGITHLLSLILPQLSPTLLRAKAADIAPILLQLLDSQAETTAVAKSVLSCIATLLAALDAASASTFHHSPFLHLFQALLVYSLDPRPKLRHLTQQRTAAVLAAFRSSQPQLRRRLMDAVLSFSQREVQSMTGRDCQEVLFLCGLLQLIGPMLTLQCRAALLELLLPVAGGKGGSSSSSSTVLYVQVMRAVVALSGRDDSSDGVEVKYVLMLDRLLTAMRDAAPHAADSEANAVFASATTAVLQLLLAVDAVRAGQQLLPYFRHYSTLLPSPKPMVARIASQTMQTLLELVVTPHWLQTAIAHGEVAELVQAAEALLGYRYKNVWQQVFPVIAALFAAFPESLRETEEEERAVLPLLQPLLTLLDSLRATPAIASDFSAHIDDAIAAAIAFHSPPAVLAVLPLNLPTSPSLSASDFSSALAASRSYLLPLIRAHTRHTALQGWFVSLLPPLLELREAQQRWAEDDDEVRRRACQLLEEEMWDALPSFCRFAVDVPAALKRRAKTMADWLDGGDDWLQARIAVCRSLVVLIRDQQEIVTVKEAEAEAEQEDDETREAKRVFEEDEQDEDDAEDDDKHSRQQARPAAEKHEKEQTAAAGGKRAVDPSSLSLDAARTSLSALSLYSKQFLPVLFKLVSDVADARRDLVLEAIACCCSIADSSTINSLFKRALKRMTESASRAAEDETERLRSHAVADIIAAMTPVLDADNLSFLYRCVSPQLSSSDSITQKKAYKTLAAICRHHPEFFSQRWREILAAVTEATSALLPSAAKVRLACLTALCLPIPRLLVDGEGDGAALLQQLPSLLGEVLLALKETNAKTRRAAYSFIDAMGAAMREGDARLQAEGKEGEERSRQWGLTSPDTGSPLFSEYVVMLLGGLAGTSPHMQSATVMAFSHLLFSCRSELPASLSAGLLSTLLPLLSSRSREVQKSMMGLLKVVCLTLSPDELRPFAQPVLDGLGSWGEEKGRNVQREKVRAVLELLMRKLGLDEVRAMVRPEQLKLLEHIRKVRQREARQKAEAWSRRRQQARGEGEEAAEEEEKTRKTDFDSVLYGSEDEQGEEDEGKVEQPSSRRSRRRERSRGAGLSVREETQDLLSADMIHNVGRRDERKEADGDQAASRKRRHEVKENAEGRLLVMEEADDGDDAQKEQKEEGKEADGRRGRKRAREEEEQSVAEPAKRAAITGRREPRSVLAGAAYAGRGGAGGDARRRGQKYDPYAFIPLDASVLNRRRQQTVKKRIETAVGGGKRKGGAAIGRMSGGDAGQRRRFTQSRQHKKHKG